MSETNRLSAKALRSLKRLQQAKRDFRRVFRLADLPPEETRRRRASLCYGMFLENLRLRRRIYKKLRQRLGITKEEIKTVSLREAPSAFLNLFICAELAFMFRGLDDIAGFVQVAPGVWMLDYFGGLAGYGFLAAERDSDGEIKNLVVFPSLHSDRSFPLVGAGGESHVSIEIIAEALWRQNVARWRGQGWTDEDILARFAPASGVQLLEMLCERLSISNFKFQLTTKLK